MSYAPGSSRESFPYIKEAIGEDPARYLDRDIFTSGQTIEARVRGIDFIDVLEAWLRVETQLDRGPRKKVIAMLNRRKAVLEEIGDRDQRAEARAIREPVKRDVIRIDKDGNRFEFETSVTGARKRVKIAENTTQEASNA